MSDRGDFGLHVRLSRRRNRYIRLTRASSLLLIAAVLCWAFGLGSTLQLLISITAGLVGLVWPVHGSIDWALTLIRGNHGLAYETALAVGDEPRDEFGLAGQVRARARSSIAGLTVPRMQQWWLAALVLALFILLLPALHLSPPWSQAEPDPPPEPVASADLEPEAEDEQAETPEPDAEEAAQDLPPQAVQPPGAGGDDREAAAAEVPGSEREGEVLDRFLDNLRERPRETGTDAELPATPIPADAESAAESPDDEPEDGTAPADEAADGDAEQSDSPAAGAEGEDGTEEGNAPDEVGEDGLPSDPQAGDDGSDPGDPGDTEAGAADDDAAAGDMGLSAGEEDGQTAGAGAGPDTFAAEQQLEGAQGEEELLEGQLSAGEVNIGGDIRLPGFSDVELPPEATPDSYGEAVERALTGGNVPLEYQEIIRNYFR